jgi:hypothetical protein
VTLSGVETIVGVHGGSFRKVEIKMARADIRREEEAST